MNTGRPRRQYRRSHRDRWSWRTVVPDHRGANLALQTIMIIHETLNPNIYVV